MAPQNAINSFWLLASAPFLLDVVHAACECGYAMTVGDERHVFADMMENDFLHLDIMGEDTQYGQYGWAAQVFNKSDEAARGPYGETYTRDAVVSNDIEDSNIWEGPGKAGDDAGLRLVVGGEGSIVDDKVKTSEIATIGHDFLHGTFRAGMKVTGTSGTCSAFFWYFNDTQEIDIEFLSAHFNPDNGTFPVNLVLQSPESNDAGYDASNTDTFKTINLPFDPTADFHEYRFDYLSDKVLFYADDELLAEMSGPAVPTEPGLLLLSHWSNGNPGWSEGPPKEDAVTTISYVKAYYNSSEPSRAANLTSRCTDPAAENAVCEIPNKDPRHFYMYQADSAPGQVIYNDDSAGQHLKLPSSLLLVTALTTGLLAFGL